MKSRRMLWIAVCVLIVGGVVAWWFLRSSSGRSRPPSGFDSAGIPVESPDLRIGVADVQGVVQGDLMRWSCELICREPDGCRADIVVKVFYRSPAEARKIAFDGKIDLAEGDTATLGGIQRPPDVIEAVERVEVTVRQIFAPGEETDITYQ